LIAREQNLVSSEQALANCPPQRIVSLSRGKVSYRTVGQGPALVFLHGLAGNSQSWVRQFQAMAGRHRVIAWDAPGFGRSDSVAADVEVFTEILAELLDFLRCGEVAVVGHSMGGVVATRLAARQPSRVSRLVLSCTHAGHGQPADSPPMARYEQRVRELTGMEAMEFGKLRARRLFPDGFAGEAFDIAARIAAEARPEGIRVATRMLQLADNRPFLPHLPMPVLILTAGLDSVVKPEHGDELLRLTATARRVTLPDLGHAPYLQSPEAYNAALDEFLGSAGRDSSGQPAGSGDSPMRKAREDTNRR